MKFSLIVARGLNGVIGRQGKIPWRLSDDLRYFKEVTMGKTIIVGRKTFQTLPPLKGRRVIVMSKTICQEELVTLGENVWAACDVDHAADIARFLSSEAIVAGGQQVYERFLRAGVISTAYVTEVHAAPPGDAYFKKFFWPWRWKITEEGMIFPDAKNDHVATVRVWERRG